MDEKNAAICFANTIIKLDDIEHKNFLKANNIVYKLMIHFYSLFTTNEEKVVEYLIENTETVFNF